MKEKNYVDNTITTLEMCAGYGGIGLGIKNIFGERLRTLAYCELEGFAQANLISKMEKGLLDAAPIWNDLKTFPYESFHGLVDVLIAGYPCQPFSAAGKRAGKEDPRHLWPWIADGIRLLQPTMCLFENVEGHISLGLSTVISDLEELGYKVSWGIFSASEVGAPHQRKRVFIMAHNSVSRSKAWFSEQTNKHEGVTGITDNCCDSATVWRTSEGFICKTCGEEVFTGCKCYHGELQCPKCNEWTYPFYYNLPEDGCQWCGAAFTKQDAWPSRPGEQQYAWEPPRVTGAIQGKLADTISIRRQQSGGECRSGEVAENGGCQENSRHRQTAIFNNESSDGGNEQTALADTNNAGWEAGGHNAISIQGRQPHELAARESDKEPAGMAHTHSSRGEEPEHQHTNLPSEPSGGNSEAVGNPTSERPHRGGKDSSGLQSEVFGKGYEAVGNSSQREDLGRESRDLGQEAGEGRCGDHAADCTGEVLGNSSNWRGGESRDEACEGQGCRTARSSGSNDELSKAKPSLGRDAYEPPIGVGISELSGLSHSELAEIREWMVKTDNRTDELRLLGNGVVPATATRAFLTLLEKITK